MAAPVEEQIAPKNNPCQFMLKICKVMPVKETSFFSMNWQQVVGIFIARNPL